MKKIILFLLLTISTNLTAQTNFHQIRYIQDGGTKNVAIKAFAKNGDYLYAASHFHDSYLKTYNIKDPGTMYLTDSIKYIYDDRNIYDLFIEGNKLYAIGTKGLTIYSLTDPAKPTQTAFITKVMDGKDEKKLNAECAVKSGNTLLCENGWNELVSMNISNTSQPVYNGRIGHTGIMKDIKLINSSTALFCDGYNAYMLNFSNPAKLTKTTITIDGEPDAICYNPEKKVAYISATSSNGKWTGIYIIDVETNQKVSSINLRSYDSEARDMSLKDSETLLLGTYDGLMVLDVSDINETKVIEYFKTPYFGGAKEAIISIDDSYFIAANYDDIIAYKWGPGGGSGINDISDEAITIFPNPVKDKLIIKGLNYNSTISIYDINGKLVYKNKAITNEVDIRNLKNGLYTIKIEDKNHNHAVIKKIIKH